MSTSFLRKITEARRADARARADAGELDVAIKEALDAPPPLDIAEALSMPGLSLIAEVKRASPSVGDIAPGVDPLQLVRAYEAGGAAAISVLTEPEFFKGSLDDLRAVRDEVSLPLLRKDFLSEPIHIYEARAAGADAVLLIVAALEQQELDELVGLAQSLGMFALVEVHDEPEVARAVQAGARIIGINTRDLKTLTVDPTVVGRLRPAIPPGIVVVGESGIGSREDAAAMHDAGCDAVLVGEMLMRAADPIDAIEDLLG